MVNPIQINKSVPQDRWIEFFDMFSSGNRGRQITIEAISQELGDEELIEDAFLMAIVYDPVGKGNDLVIETGRAQVSYAHTIDAPTEVWIGQDENGVVLAIRVVDAQGETTILTLK
jgi:uncharacterized protein YuzE